MSIKIMKWLNLRNIRLAELNGLKSFRNPAGIDWMIFGEANVEKIIEKTVWSYNSNRPDREATFTMFFR